MKLSAEEEAKVAEEIEIAENEKREKLMQMPWFFGDLDRKTAEAFLLACKEDSFLVRTSSVEDSYALSLYNFEDQTVHHVLIKVKALVILISLTICLN